MRARTDACVHRMGGSVGKWLVITEKPSVAQDIVRVLGGFQEHDGYWESDEWLVTYAVGHLFELLEPEELDPKYKAWTLEVLPILPDEKGFQLKPKKGQSERIRTIKKLAGRDDVDGFVNACDAGREGELIFREIVSYLGSTKPIRRLWLQSMTTDAIRGGFDHLLPGEELDGLAASAECRAYSDWLIGMNSTRALTKRLASRKEKTAWSAGRVQTPTLALLVDRELEVLAHVPKPYWRVKGVFQHEGETYEGQWFDPAFQANDDEARREDRIFDEAAAKAIVEAVAGQTGTARETRKPSKESAPPLFDLTSLQREGNRRFGWSARRTLSAAQRCYERHKLLTYPRTDSRCLPEDYRETVNQVLQSYAGAGETMGKAHDGAFADHRMLVLADLIALRQIGIEIVLPVEPALPVNLRVEAEPGANRLLDTKAIDHGQHARHRRIHQRHVRIRLAAIRRASAGKQLCLRRHLRMHFQANDDLPLAFLPSDKLIGAGGADVEFGHGMGLGERTRPWPVAGAPRRRHGRG